MRKQTKISKVSFLRPAKLLTFLNLARKKKSLATPAIDPFSNCEFSPDFNEPVIFS